MQQIIAIAISSGFKSLFPKPLPRSPQRAENTRPESFTSFKSSFVNGLYTTIFLICQGIEGGKTEEKGTQSLLLGTSKKCGEKMGFYI